jgi:hypothetical protein
MKPPNHTPAPVFPQRAYPFLLLRYAYYSIYTMIPPLLPPFPFFRVVSLIGPSIHYDLLVLVSRFPCCVSNSFPR